MSEAEEALRRQLDLLTSLVDHAQAIIVAKDLDGRYLFVNAEYGRLFGRTTDEFLGRTDDALFPAEVAARFREADLLTLSLDRVVRLEEQIPVGGEDRHYLSVKFPIRDEAGQVVATGLVATDITARKRLEEQLRELATVDPLTGAANRRHFWDAAARELGRTRRYDRPLAVLMLDLDHFKRVNDTFGHAAGDEVLRTLAGTIRAGLRGTDDLGRVGGEEFAVLLPETDTASATALAERLRRAVASTQVVFDEQSISVTVSVGVAGLHADDDIDALLRRADAALYRAKADGRDRVAVD